MPEVTVRVYADLNDFLLPTRRHVAFPVVLEVATSVKDLIEAVGVPHPEIGLVVIDGEPVKFTHRVRGGERVSVYPPFRRLELGELASLLRPPLEGEIRFVADAHLGRLAGYLRLAGFDTVYQRDLDDRDAAAISAQDRRVLLTRDQHLLKRAAVEYGYWVRATGARQQFQEVVERFELVERFVPFSRCLRCNSPLVPVSKADVAGRLPPRTREIFDEFAECPTCRRVYWQGSHYGRMTAWLAQVAASCQRAETP